MILGEPYGVEADWWSLGATIYALKAGHGPYFYEKEKDKATLQRDVRFGISEDDDSRCLDDSRFCAAVWPMETVDIISELMERDASKRLGTNSFDEITAHPYVLRRHGGRRRDP